MSAAVVGSRQGLNRPQTQQEEFRKPTGERASGLTCLTRGFLTFVIEERACSLSRVALGDSRVCEPGPDRSWSQAGA